MIRRILIDYIIPLILPTVLYILVQVWRQRRAAQGVSVRPILIQAPWVWLAVAGVALGAASLVAVAVFSGGAPGERYVPARVEDGAVAPGGYAPAPAQK